MCDISHKMKYISKWKVPHFYDVKFQSDWIMSIRNIEIEVNYSSLIDVSAASTELWVLF